jgi:hypothetical protein
MTRTMCLFVFLCVSDCVFSRVGASRVGRPTYIYICINAPEGCRHGTHTNETAYIRGTYSRVHTHTNTNTNKHTTWPDKVRCGLTPWRRPPHQRRVPRPHPQQAASLSRSPTPKLCAPPPTGAVRVPAQRDREPRRRRPAHFVLVLPFR